MNRDELALAAKAVKQLLANQALLLNKNRGKNAVKARKETETIVKTISELLNG